MELSNAHDPVALCHTAYTEDAIYYNRERVYRGPEEIAAVYTYMAGPRYQVDLECATLVTIGGDLAHEIGRWIAGGRSGYYVIIWEKQAAGDWRIRLDSNY